MHRLSIVSSTNTRTRFYPLSFLFFQLLSKYKSFAVLIFALSFLATYSNDSFGQEQQREAMEMSVVVVNPSDTKVQTVPIKMYLPKEVTPDVIIDSAGLDIEYDADKSMYFLYKEEVKLKPSETKNFNVEIEDIWRIPEQRLDALSKQTESIVARLEGSEFYDSAKLLQDAINKSLETITVTQNNDAVSRRTHIGIYRNNAKIVDQVKEDVEQLEKQLQIVMSSPKPEVLEKAKLKTESPDKNTSWMIIFIIMLFIAMLAGVFFFTWQTQAHATKSFISEAREASFPENKPPEDAKK